MRMDRKGVEALSAFKFMVRAVTSISSAGFPASAVRLAVGVPILFSRLWTGLDWTGLEWTTRSINGACGNEKMGVPARVRSGELGAGAAVCLPVLAVGRCAKCGKHEWAPRFSNREQRPYS